jgi:hypothetical protein
LLAAVSLVFLSIPVMVGEVPVTKAGAGNAMIDDLTKAFSRDNPGVTFTAPKSIFPGGGIEPVSTDATNLGRVGRGITENEKSSGRMDEHETFFQ